MLLSQFGQPISGHFRIADHLEGGQTSQYKRVYQDLFEPGTVASVTGSHFDELAADDNDVVVAHVGSSVPACSATI